MVISDIIKERRKKLNMTQNQLAEMIGVTPQAISKWEKGIGCPDVSLLVALSKALGVSVDNMLGGDRRNELEKAWEEACRFGEEISLLFAVDALEEFPEDETFLYRRACGEYFVGLNYNRQNGSNFYFEKAECHFNELLEKNPDNISYKTMLAEVLFAQGKKEEAKSLAYACNNDDLIEKFSEPETRLHLKQKKIKQNTLDLYYKLLDYNTRESITAAYGLLDIIMDEDKQLYGNYRSELCVKDALLYFDEENYQRYAEKLTEAYEIAKAYDNLPFFESYAYHNPLFNSLRLEAFRQKAIEELLNRFLFENKLAHSSSLALRRRFADEIFTYCPLQKFRGLALYRFFRNCISQGNYINFGTGWYVTAEEFSKKVKTLVMNRAYGQERFIKMNKDEIEQFVRNGVMRGYTVMFSETIVAFCHCVSKQNFKTNNPGFFADEKVGKKTLLIAETFIAHNFRECGIEEKLISFAINDAKKNGFTHIELFYIEGIYPKEDQEYLETKLELYKRMGFFVIRDLSEEGNKKYIMQKEL